ncbi:MAG: hypothetical protein LUC47_01950 [Clostridiales bacterium]|nr:hypothetical protein [Clostridiales bacterium]
MPSNYQQWLQRDVQPEEKIQRTPQEKRKNWWHYYKWIVVGGVVVVGITLSLILNAFGVGVVKPDYQIAYVGSSDLPDDTAEALTAALEALGEDLNGDGKVVVTLNQYCSSEDTEGDDTAAMQQYASEVELIADISDCESYFFLLEDPETFQTNYQVLAEADGSCPEETDYDWEDKVYLWSDCPVLDGLELGDYTESVLGETLTGESRDLLENLYFGRRCFYEENSNTVDNQEGCEALWELLIEGATK